eukprot:2241551-Lingulodinium_polyedra.AAC.1
MDSQPDLSPLSEKRSPCESVSAFKLIHRSSSNTSVAPAGTPAESATGGANAMPLAPTFSKI